MARVEVFTRKDCPLCESAISTVAEVCADLGIDYNTTDIDADPQLRERYTNEVPVTFVDGHQHDYWRVDPLRLRAALRA